MRKATNQDVPAIMAALLAMLPKANGRGQMAYAEPMEAELSVRHAIFQERAVIVDGYFIMFDVGSPWYTTKRYLIEDIILKIEKTDAPVDTAIQALDVLARKYGCDAIAVGDTQIGYMTPKYINHGYATLGTQLFKGVPDGIRPQDHGGAVAD
jgi:hypothetical protein